MTGIKTSWQKQLITGIFYILSGFLLGMQGAYANLLGIAEVFPRIAYAAPGGKAITRTAICLV